MSETEVVIDIKAVPSYPNVGASNVPSGYVIVKTIRK